MMVMIPHIRVLQKWLCGMEEVTISRWPHMMGNADTIGLDDAFQEINFVHFETLMPWPASRNAKTFI
jgi:hypothetical protein